MAQPRFYLSDFKSRDLPLLWHEAVAIVQELGDLVQRGATGGVVPDFEALAISPTGDILVTEYGKRTGQPVRDLAAILRSLLEDTPCPNELRLLATQDLNVTTVHATIEEFLRALSFFARPDRKGDLQKVAGRAVVALERQLAEEELQRLAAKAQNSPDNGRPVSVRPPRRLSRRAIAWWVAAVLLAAAATAGWTYRAPIEVRLGPLGRTAAARLRPVGEAVAARFASLTSKPAAPSAGPAPGEGKATSEPARRASAVAAGRTRSGGGPAASKVEITEMPGSTSSAGQGNANGTPSAAGVAGPGLTPEATPPRPGPATATDVSSPSGRGPGGQVVYTEADAGVTSPAWVRPQIPTEPPLGASLDQYAEADILIDEAGLVQSVRWVRRVDGYQERMMTSAMKAWRFAPATKDGQPVRFMKRVRLMRS